MTSKYNIPLGLQAALGFGIFLALILAITYCVSFLPSAEQGCLAHCATSGKRGSMVPIYRWEQTAGVRGIGPVECKCS